MSILLTALALGECSSFQYYNKNKFYNLYNFEIDHDREKAVGLEVKYVYMDVFVCFCFFKNIHKCVLDRLEENRKDACESCKILKAILRVTTKMASFA